MKAIFSVLALAIALACTAPAFAGDVTTAKNQAGLPEGRRHVGRQDADMLREKDVVGDNWPSGGVGFGRRPFRPQPLSRAAANQSGRRQ